MNKFEEKDIMTQTDTKNNSLSILWNNYSENDIIRIFFEKWNLKTCTWNTSSTLEIQLMIYKRKKYLNMFTNTEISITSYYQTNVLYKCSVK